MISTVGTQREEKVARIVAVEQIDALIAPTVEAMGYAVVRVQLSGRHRQRLQVMIERLDGRSIQVEDCANVSRALSAILDVDDPIPGAYTLEVSSPGIDRPLVRLADFERFAGFEARVEMDRPIEGRRRFQGRVVGTEAELVRLRLADIEVALPHADILRAKLVLTDDLIAAHGEQTSGQVDKHEQ